MTVTLTMTMKARLVAVWMLVATACAAQQPKVVNAQISVREHANLAQEVASSKGLEWLGYTVAAVRELHTGWGQDKEYLEGSPKYIAQVEQKPGDPQRRAVILLRVTDGKVGRVQITDAARELDAGGLPFVWLNDVPPADSLAVLQTAVEASAASVQATSAVQGAGRPGELERQSRRVMESGLLAIGLHDVPQATPMLRGFTAAKYGRPVREKAAFWLANERGREGFEAVSALLKTPDDDAFRELLVFDLTLVQEPAKKAALDELLSVARTDASPKVRSKAQFWLAQMVSRKGDRNGEEDGRIAQSLSESARNDPDAAIRKSAVFALSRLPQEQAAQELIQVASSTRDVSTRREAIFWLGQSKDPKALAYLEKVVRE